MGLIGKTAIHPSQVPIIHGEFAPSAGELQAAAAVLQRENGGVFSLNGMMLEPAVHWAWAKEMMAKAESIRLARQDGTPSPNPDPGLICEFRGDLKEVSDEEAVQCRAGRASPTAGRQAPRDAEKHAGWPSTAVDQPAHVLSLADEVQR